MRPGLQPRRFGDKVRHGLGASPPRHDVGALRNGLLALLACVRRTRRAPLLAHRSYGWMLPKPGKSGIESIRLVHGLGDFWKSYYKGLEQEGDSAPAPYLYSFVQGGRREAAMCLPRITLERARKEKLATLMYPSD